MDSRETVLAHDAVSPAMAGVISAGTGLIALDAQRCFVWINDYCADLIGYDLDEIKGRNIELLEAGHYTNEQVQGLWRKVDTGETVRFRNQYRSKSGETAWVQAVLTAERDEDGNITGYCTAFTDVSDLVDAAKTRKRMISRAEYTRIVNKVFEIERADMPLDAILRRALDILFKVPWLDVLSKGGVFLLDPDDDQTLRLACSHSLGPDIESLCARVRFGHCLCGRAAQMRQLIHASCVDERHEVRFDAMQPHGHYNVPIMIGGDLVGVLVVYLEHGMQKTRDHEAFLTEFANALGVLIGFKQREEALVAKKQEALVAAELAQKAMIEAQKAEQAKSNFLSTMSHELRTPMNGIVGMLHVLKMSELDPEQEDNINLALSSADLLLNIINDILDFTKLEYGALKLEDLPVDLPAMAGEMAAAFTPLAREKGLEIRYTLADDLPRRIMGDPTRLRQICNNFLSNAIKFTSSGHVLLEFERQPGDGEGTLLIKVTDTGIGLDEEAAKVIFDRFTQADDSITRQFGGTGLGLSICRELATAMGGEVGVDSEKGKGSTFWVRLPLREARADLAASA